MDNVEGKIIYLIGLAILAISIGSYTNIPEYAFMIIGGGMVLFSVVTGILHYLHKE